MVLEKKPKGGQVFAEVLIIQRRLTQYRVPLFDRLRSELAKDGISLRLVYGQPAPNEINKKDSSSIKWAEKARNYYLRFGSKYLCWQSLPVQIGKNSLIIITQENSILSNYALLVRRALIGSQLAFWGHGANLQSTSPNGFRERFKRWTTCKVDWWFAYTSLSVELVAKSGFPVDSITNLENAIDTTAIKNYLDNIKDAELVKLRGKLAWSKGKIGLFLGSLHNDKRLGFLFQAIERIHKHEPEFKFIIVGDGPLRYIVKEFCEKRAWCKWVGAKTGREKAMYLRLADVILNPGMVGLGILDSFISRVPMVTTDCGLHSPEIVYLRQGENGLMTNNNLKSFVNGVQNILKNDQLRMQLSSGCQLAANHYTIENMVKNFHYGILKALEASNSIREN